MKYNDIFINYVEYGEKSKKTIVLLHGWGQNIEMMKPIGDALSNKYHIVIIDLPGFGSSDEPKTAYTIYDYYDVVKYVLDKLKIKNPVMCGHSFGGRISIIYSALEKVDKLILLSAPFKKRIEKLSLKVKILKSLKKVPLLNKLEGFAKKHIGSTDYKNSSEIMRKILVNTVNTDLEEYVKKIKCSTILIAGEFDTAVPLDEMKEYENLIEDSALIVYPNATHYAYLENLGQTVSIIDNLCKNK